MPYGRPPSPLASSCVLLHDYAFAVPALWSCGSIGLMPVGLVTAVLGPDVVSLYCP